MNKQGKCKCCKKLTFNKKFCSKKCCQKYFKKYRISAFYNFKIRHIICSNGGKRANTINKKNHTSFCYDSKLRKKAIASNKRNRKDAFHNFDIQSKGGKNAHELHPTLAHNCAMKMIEHCRKKKKGSFFNIIEHRKVAKMGGSKSNILRKKNKIGFYDQKIQKRTQELLAKYKHIYFNGIYFRSRGECEIAMNIHYQIEQIKLYKNCQFIVGIKLYDNFVKKYNCFIEYHPFNSMYCDKETYKKYYKIRKNNLNKNGYKDYNLLVIQ